MALFKRKTPEEKFIAKEMKKIEDRTKRTLTLSEYAGTLAKCRAIYEKEITLSTLDVRKRRKTGISDSAAKKRIHDSCVALLAIEEAEIELGSVQAAKDFKDAQKSLRRVLRKLYYIDRSFEVSGKDLKKEQGLEFEDTNELRSFCDRAELVDEQFVEDIIGGKTLKEALKKTLTATISDVSYGGGSVDGIDFSNFEEHSPENDAEFLKGDAGSR